MENEASEGKDPSAFLSEIAGAPVTVKLNSGVVYKGLGTHVISLADGKLSSNAAPQASCSPWMAT